jgi:HK97 family phage portal protein
VGNLARRITAAAVNPNGTTSISSPASWLIEALGGTKTPSGIKVNVDKALSLTTAWRCITLLSFLRATLPRKVMRARAGGGADVARDHPNHRLLSQSPNSWQTSFEQRDFEGRSLFGWGNAYDVLERDRTGRILSMIPIHPERVTVYVDSGGNPVYQVRLYPSEQTQWYSRYEMYHLKLNTGNGYTGLSPVEACRDSIAVSLGLQEFVGRTLAGGGLIAGVLELPPGITPEVEKQIKESWKDSHGSVENIGKVAALKQGTKFTPIGMKLTDAQTLDLLGLGMVQTCQIWGVPPALAGYTSPTSSWGAGEIARYMGFLALTVNPILVADEQALFRDMFRPEEFEVVWPAYNRGALLDTDLLTRYRAYAIGRQWGWLTVNRILSKEDENPVGAEGDVLLDPTNMARIPIDPTSSLDGPGNGAASFGDDPRVRAFLQQALTGGAMGAEGADHA